MPARLSICALLVASTLLYTTAPVYAGCPSVPSGFLFYAEVGLSDSEAGCWTGTGEVLPNLVERAIACTASSTCQAFTFQPTTGGFASCVQDPNVRPRTVPIVDSTTCYGLFVKISGNVTVWGYDGGGQMRVPVEAQSGASVVAAGNAHSLAIVTGGRVVGWGSDAVGQTSVPVSAQSNVYAIAAGSDNSLALSRSGAVIAWGSNNFGKSTVPEPAQSDVVAIDAGFSHCLALLSSGQVIAWGNDKDGRSDVPQAAQSGVAAVAAGYHHSLALFADGSVLGWGQNGQSQATIPPGAQTNAMAVSGGAFHTLVLLNDGTIKAWGNNDYGQCTVPASVQGRAVAIAAGGYFSMALLDDLTVVAWGNANNGATAVPSDVAPAGAIVGGDRHGLGIALPTTDTPGAAPVTSPAPPPDAPGVPPPSLPPPPVPAAPSLPLQPTLSPPPPTAPSPSPPSPPPPSPPDSPPPSPPLTLPPPLTPPPRPLMLTSPPILIVNPPPSNANLMPNPNLLINPPSLSGPAPTPPQSLPPPPAPIPVTPTPATPPAPTSVNAQPSPSPPPTMQLPSTLFPLPFSYISPGTALSPPGSGGITPGQGASTPTPSPGAGSTTTSTTGDATTTQGTTTRSASKPATGAIAGGVTGALVAVALLALLFLFLWRRKRNREAVAVVPAGDAVGKSGPAYKVLRSMSDEAPHVDSTGGHSPSPGHIAVPIGRAAGADVTGGSSTPQGGRGSSSDLNSPRLGGHYLNAQGVHTFAERLQLHQTLTAGGLPSPSSGTASVPLSPIIVSPDGMRGLTGVMTRSSGVTSIFSSDEDNAYQKGMLHRLRIPWESIKLGRVLGEGGYGTVYRGVWQGNAVAVKMLNIEHMTQGTQDSLRQEALAMFSRPHPCIAHVYGLVDDGEHCALVMKYYRRGTLLAAIADLNYSNMKLGQRLKLAQQVASGMCSLHERDMLHCDLKTANLLIEDDGCGVVITDFGLAGIAGQAIASGALTVTISPPEVLEDPMRPRTRAGDVYAFGIVLLEIVGGRPAYQGVGREMLRNAVIAGRRPAIPACVPDDVAEIITACWRQDADERPSFPEVVAMLDSAILLHTGERDDDVTRTVSKTTAMGLAGMWPKTGVPNNLTEQDGF